MTTTSQFGDIVLASETAPLKLAPSNVNQIIGTARFLLASGMAQAPSRAANEEIAAIQVAGAITAGSRIGLDPFQAVQSIAIINGRPCLWGDAMMAVVQASGLLESYREVWAPNASNPEACQVIVTRRGIKGEFVGTFTMKNAQDAGLLAKGGPWKAFAADMLLARARARALRRGFADVLGGLYSADEMTDAVASSEYQAKHDTPRLRRVTPAPTPAPAPTPVSTTDHEPNPVHEDTEQTFSVCGATSSPDTPDASEDVMAAI